MNSENIGGLSIIVVLVILYVVMELVSLYFKEIIIVVAIGLAVFIWLKLKKKRITQAASAEQERMEKWLLNHLGENERKLEPSLKQIVQSQEMVIHRFQEIDMTEPPKIYQNLEERKAYLEALETNIINLVNERIKEEYSFLRPVSHKYNVENFFRFLTETGYRDFQILQSLETGDYNKQAEIKLYSNFGIDINYAEQVEEYLRISIGNYLSNMDEKVDKELRIISAGLIGEERVQNELEVYNDVFKSLFNVRLEVEGNSVESDALIFSKKGVFTLEIKNFGSSGSYEIKVTKDGQWLKVFPNGNEEPMKDVASQSNRHVGYKQKFINQKLKDAGVDLDYVFIDPIIVIANDNVKVNNESENVILRASQIYNYIKNKNDIITEEQAQILFSLFKENMLEPKKYPYEDFEKGLRVLLQLANPAFLYLLRIKDFRTKLYQLVEAEFPAYPYGWQGSYYEPVSISVDLIHEDDTDTWKGLEQYINRLERSGYSISP